MQHDAFFKFALQWHVELASDCDVQPNFDTMYGIMTHLLNHFYREREITADSKSDVAMQISIDASKEN